MQAALEIAGPLIQRWEGCARRRPDGLIEPYLCAAGYPTIGWGEVVPSMQVPPITQAEADARFDRLLRRFTAEALAASPGLAAHPRRLAAIVSFCFNLGTPRYRASTLRRRVDAQDWPEAQREIVRWDRAGGRRLRGLTLRREQEAALLA